ncbi:ABC transporter permease, partial [Klebsiella pneumoniae]|nr:ABC transporter permease [Klebsiella pneumoniae]
MMSRSLSQTGESKRRFSWPTGTPQIAALLVVLLVDSLVAPHFFQIIVQDG